MDDIVARYRYPRHSTYYRRRRRATKASCSTAEKVARQVAISALILLIAIVIKSIDTPVTNFLTSKITSALTVDIEFKEVYDGINNFIAKLKRDPQEKDDEPSKEIVLGSSYQEGQEFTGEKDIEEITKDIKDQYNFIAPLEGTLSSSFGDRVDPFTRKLKHHYGVDIDAGQGADIKAAFDGLIVEAQSDKGYGSYIKIEHGDELYTIYAHCSELIAKKGQKVKQGEVIARVGDTGLAIGSHLHFEIWKDGEALDPLFFIFFTL